MQQDPHLLKALATYLYLGNSEQEQGHGYCVLPPHSHSWKTSLKSLLMILPQHPTEQQGTQQVRLALDATSAGDKSAVQPASSHSSMGQSLGPQ